MEYRPNQSAWSDRSDQDSTRRNSTVSKDLKLDVKFEDDRRLQMESPTPTMEKGGKDHGHDHGHGDIDIDDPNRPRFPLRQRMHHFTFAWYTLPMSTGGLSLLVFAQPHQFPGLRQIGYVIYVINLFFFTGISSGLLARFFLHPGDFTAALTHRREGFFFPTFFLSIATLITSTHRYVIPENDATLIWAIQVAFWGYLILTIMLALGQYSYVFAAQAHGLHTMMPTWILPIFPIMLTGTIASVIADTQPDISAVPVIVAGLTCQGLGLSVAIMMYAHMVGRLMAVGLPDREHRPAIYMCVGPPAFTALALIGMANGLPNNFDPDLDGIIIDAGTIRTSATMCAIFLWALAFWWFGITTIAVLSAPPKYFHLGMYAMIFPNTGFTLATIAIGNQLRNEPVLWVATGMSIALFVMFIFIFYLNVKAVITQDIMYPGRDEDVAH